MPSKAFVGCKALALVKKGSLGSLFWLCCWWSQGAVAGPCELSGEQLGKLDRVVVRQVYDGDTVALADGRKVRLIGVNTPELARDERPAEPLADKASRLLRQWQGEAVYLQVGLERKDRYGRVLGHLFTLEGENITARILQEGMGFVVAIPPNVAFAECYLSKAYQAKQDQLGVWAEPYFRVRSVSMESEIKGGFGRYRGKIARIVPTKNVIWVDFIGHVSLRIDRDDLPHLKGEVLERLLIALDQDKVLQLPHLVVSGWLMDRTRWGKRMAELVASGKRKRMAELVASGKRKRWQMNIRHRNHWQWL